MNYRTLILFVRHLRQAMRTFELITNTISAHDCMMCNEDARINYMITRNSVALPLTKRARDHERGQPRRTLPLLLGTATPIRHNLTSNINQIVTEHEVCGASPLTSLIESLYNTIVLHLFI